MPAADPANGLNADETFSPFCLRANQTPMDATTICRYMAQQEMALNSVFVAEGIAGSLLTGHQGPTTLTYRLRIHQPTAAILARVMRLASAIESALGAAPVRVATIQGVVHIETPSPWPVAISAERLTGRGLCVPVGLAVGRDGATGQQTVVRVDFSQPDQAHLGLFGATGSGKSTALLALLYHLARQNRPAAVRSLIICVPAKARTWQAVAALPHCAALLTDLPEIAAALAWTADLVRQRRGRCPEWFVVMDDAQDVLSTVDVTESLQMLARVGREPGVHLLLSTQTGGKAGTGATANNLRARLIFAAADAQSAATLAGRGQTGAERLGATPGETLLIIGSQESRFTVSAVPPAAWAALPQRCATYHPWSSPITGDNAGGGLAAVAGPLY
ncbi:MAG: hypothetical protein CVU38_15470 [Chloroflexi bacterium HGW-Chloroflexi-1]|nr:MAG: hypothetical protein CVU38_15470 [Chloroflexi bacterium HGW-Chloroflexi-1]